MPSEPQNNRCLWFGNLGKGVGVLCAPDYRLSIGPFSPNVPDSVYPVIIDGPVSFHLLAVWTQKHPTYISTLFNAVERYRGFLQESPSVIVGDFNSHRRWDRTNPIQNHTSFVSLLERDFGIVSAYHTRPGYAVEIPEEPTHYWRWNELNPYHLDYCFIPKAWVQHIKTVEVGSFTDWSSQSDHSPLVVDIDITYIENQLVGNPVPGLVGCGESQDLSFVPHFDEESEIGGCRVHLSLREAADDSDSIHSSIDQDCDEAIKQAFFKIKTTR